jgi:sigma-B regulation protein RsbQ
MAPPDWPQFKAKRCLRNPGRFKGLATPTLILQSTDDIIAPIAVGDYLNKVMPQSVLRVVDNEGHCPHLSAPGECITEMNRFLADVAVINGD